MSDEHVSAGLSVIGSDLVCLELIDCSFYVRDSDNDDADPLADEELTDVTMTAIACACHQLESLSITGSVITSLGLEKVLKANHGLRTLDLSSSDRLARHVPFLRSKRHCNACPLTCHAPKLLGWS
jgi:hypothetical protein|mmetsp:Transcript_31186/g.56492  ORF Transcript_31186/g.56492 Transcript_31186/m.56492 type:complete len:126 (-) Transcript_31186:422-799(-)